MFVEKSIDADKKQVPLSEIKSHLDPGHVVVIDIAQLPDYLQSFVVGDVIDLIRRAKIGNGADDDEDKEDSDLPTLETVILFADELNKFAPRHGQARSITHHLREISERGRSEGIILFGAEQFRSGVADQVTGNSGTQVFGRTTRRRGYQGPGDQGAAGKPDQARTVPEKGRTPGESHPVQLRHP